MRRKTTWLATLCTALLTIFAVAPAQGAVDDPLFVFTPEPPKSPLPPPPPPIPPFAGYFEGPCGLAVDSAANIYVSDYYREPIADHNAVDVFGPEPIEYPYDYRTQIREVDPLDGPCGLAIDGDGTLYVNDYHRAVLRYETSEFPPPPIEPFKPPFPEHYGAATAIDTDHPSGTDAHPTGVALDPVSEGFYVNNRTYLYAYDSSGVPIEAGGERLRIGLGSLEDGYGLAVSDFPGTAGLVYVADAASDTVKVYDPGVDVANPVEEIDGSEVPGGGFVSLRDSAVAVDRVSGKVYVADNLQPQFTEHPEAAIYVFAPDGAYLGRLKHNVVDALPPGLAVDNSGEPTQGRVFVTSGDTEYASVYAYGPGAETDTALPPLPRSKPELGGLPGGLFGAGSAVADGSAGPVAGASTKDGPVLAQKGDLRLTVNGAFAPRALPRRGVAPISIRVGGRVSTVGDGELPQLNSIRIEFNRNGRMQTAGLPVCPAESIRIASTRRALRACRPALLGTGSFEANVSLSGQDPYPTQGRMLLFNAGSERRPVMLGHIYAARPFATSFLIHFQVSKRRRGTYGTTIAASLPQALGEWGYLTAIEMKLSRTYHHRGERLSFVSASCPAPRGFSSAFFPLARASFGFSGGKTLGATITRSCRAREP